MVRELALKVTRFDYETQMWLSTLNWRKLSITHLLLVLKTTSLDPKIIHV